MPRGTVKDALLEMGEEGGLLEEVLLILMEN